MRKFLWLPVLVVGLAAAIPAHGDDYVLDAAHTGVVFKIGHIGLSNTYGRFNDVAGTLTLGTDPAKSAINLTIKTESIDTGNTKRDEHLRNPDFFNAKQFPVISFKSTSVKAIKGGLEVTGDFTMHGVTKPVTLTLMGGKTAEFPKGTMRTGYSTQLTLKRSDYDMGKFTEAVGDEVQIEVSFEATKK